GYGGLLRDNHGDFIWGYYGAATVENILFNLIRQGVTAHHCFANEIHSIRRMLENDWEVVITHTLREGNACADVLAKMDAIWNSPLVKISTPSSDLC
ncbi:hypothetical protein L195_g037934, partial [Trifolium pratense]